MSSRPDERGAVAIMVAVLATTLFIVAAMVVDLGLARDTKRQSQSAADSSALAAANALYPVPGIPDFDAATAAAKAYALANFGVEDAAWTSCTDPGIGSRVPAATTSCISFDDAVEPTNVRVVVPTRTVDTTLGALAGVQEIDIATSARAALAPPGLPCIVCVLGSGLTHDIQNGDVLVDGGNVHFNGNVSVNANGLIVTDGITTVEGTASGPLSSYSPDPTTGVDPIPDPMSYLVLPPDMTGLTVRTNPCTQGPGKYGSVDLRNMVCTLSPGLYVIAGGSGTTWDLAGNAGTRLLGTGVTLYFTCGSPTTPTTCGTGVQGATMDASGNGTVEISGPTSGPLQGATIVFDRNNSSTIRMTGNGFSTMDGSIYAPSGRLQMNGNGCTATNAAIVVRTIEMNGNPACLSVQDADGHPEPPPGGLHLDQ